MRTTSEWQREWRQLRLLSRDSVHRLLDRVVVSHESDPVQFALWAAVLAMTPPLVVGVRKLTQYAFLHAVGAVDPMLTARILTAERLFFVLYGMLVSALFAALIWETLYPDRTDQEIVGVLPVRPRTLAAARLGAAVAVGVLASAAISIPSGLVYSVASLAHPVGSLPRVLAGHLLATMGGCAFVFLSLVALRGVVAICAGERTANRLALLLQFTTIVGLIEIFLFLPYVVLTLVGAMQAAGSSSWFLPPLWFTGLYIWMADGNAAFADHARLAVSVTAAAAVAVGLVSLGPAAWMGRRALHVQTRDRASLAMFVARGVARICTWQPVVRSLFLFGVASLTRSRRHVLILARYVGMAIAAGILSAVGAVLRRTFQFADPQPYLMAVPLVFIFFAVFGLRAAVAIPAEIDANWPFRLAPPTVDAALRATRLLIVSCGIVPIVAAWLSITLTVWPADLAVRTAALDVAAGLLVMEISLLGWTRIPFAAAREPATETLKSRWMWYLVFLLIFAKGGAALKFDVAQSTTSTLTSLLVAAIALAGLRVWRHQQRRLRATTVEPVASQIETLDLSEAVN